MDDEADLEVLILQKFRRRIRDGAVSFAFARDGVEALAVLETDLGFDLVVSDINMPRMGGLTLLKTLQGRQEKISTVIVSAYGDMANIRTAMNWGAFDFIMKPIDFLDFETTIARKLRHSPGVIKADCSDTQPGGYHVDPGNPQRNNIPANVARYPGHSSFA